MTIWVDPLREHEYVLEAERDRPEAEQTKFKYRILTAREYAVVSDLLRRDESGEWFVNFNEYRLRFLKFCLTGWSGPNAPAFEKGEDGYVKDQCLDHLAYEFRAELASAIDNAHKLDKEDAGKS